MKSGMRLANVSLLLILCGATLHAQWTQWRGPARDGVVAPASVPAAWPMSPALKWKQAVGEGYSSPLVFGGRVYVHSRRDPNEVVTALDLATGKPVWSATYPSSFTKNKYANEMAKGPFSTPLAADGRLFTLGARGVLSAFDAVTGTLRWRKDWSADVDTSRLFTGTAMSPILDGGLLVVHVGDDDGGSFRALEPATGAEKWSLPGHGPGYASPIVAISAGTRQLISMTDRAIVGIEVATGKQLWLLPFPDEWNENIVTPVMAGDVLVVSGTRKGTSGYRLEKTASGWSPRQIWNNTDLPMYMSSPVADGPFIYGFGSKRKGQLFCLDARTGATKWTTEGRGGANAAIQSAGPHLVVLTTDGVMLILKRNSEKYEEVRRYALTDSPTWAQPVVLPTELVVRDANSVAVWSLK